MEAEVQRTIHFEGEDLNVPDLGDNPFIE